MSNFRRQFQDLFDVITTSATVNPSSLADAAGETLVVSVPGAAVGDAVWFFPGTDLLDVVVTAYVAAADSVELRVQNESAGVRDILSSTWKFVIVKPKF